MSVVVALRFLRAFVVLSVLVALSVPAQAREVVALRGSQAPMILIEDPTSKGLPFLAITQQELHYGGSAHGVQFRALRLCRHLGYDEAFVRTLKWRRDRATAVYADDANPAVLKKTIEGDDPSIPPTWATFTRIGCSRPHAGATGAEAADTARAARMVYGEILNENHSAPASGHRGAL